MSHDSLGHSLFLANLAEEEGRMSVVWAVIIVVLLVHEACHCYLVGGLLLVKQCSVGCAGCIRGL